MDFFRAYLERLKAIETGNIKEFESASSKMIDIGSKPEAPIISKHLLAKELYKVALNMMSSGERKQRQTLMKEAYELFEKSAALGVSTSYYYLGEMNEKAEGVPVTNFKQAFEYYTKAAEDGYPRAYFVLAQ